MLTHRRLEVLAEVGIGTVTDPVLTLRFSDDGGKTWQNELAQSLGNLGNYQTRLVWEKLGQSLARQYEIVCTDAMPVRLIDAYVEVEA